jgi:hypothetical protein
MKNRVASFLRKFSLAVLLIAAVSCVDDSQLYDNREFWVGSWTCSEIEGDFAPQTYPVEIVERVVLTEVGIKGLYNQGLSFTVIAEISGDNLVIPTQIVDDIQIAGSGNLENEEIILFFDADDGSGVDQVKAMLVR